MDIWYYLHKAAEAAGRDKDDPRVHALGALAIRDDKVVVTAKNGFSTQKQPESHAERRLLRKCDKGSVVFVARQRRTGEMGLSRPCPMCDAAMRARGVKRVYYSINDSEYGVIDYA